MVYEIQPVTPDIEDLAAHIFNIDPELRSIIKNESFDPEGSEEPENESEIEIVKPKKKRGSTTTASSTMSVPPSAPETISIHPDYIQTFRDSLVSWYIKERRHLPWRGDHELPITPYGVWISEVMCQQTRVDTVINYWLRWMETFPTVKDLAQAKLDDVHKLWAGLGYYRRAENLLNGAKFIMENFDGVLPSKKDDLLRIPGIGPYTAGAISSLAFEQKEGLVDGNVLRVFSRLFALRHRLGGKLEKISWSIAEILIKNEEDPRSFNQGLMELGAMVCKPVNPTCESCPVRQSCWSKKLEENFSKNVKKIIKTEKNLFQNEKILIIDLEDEDKNEENNKNNDKKIQCDKFDSNHFPYNTDQFSSLPPPVQEKLSLVLQEYPVSVGLYPFKAEKKAPKDVIKIISVIELVSNGNDCSKNNQFLFLKRPAKGLLANQWEFPSLEVTSLTENTTEKLYRANRSFIEKNLVKKCGFYISKGQEHDETYGEGHPLDLDGTKISHHKEIQLSSPVGPSPVAFLGPILHIFSHEKHQMYILHDKISLTSSIESNYDNSETCEIQWKTAEEILDIGLTTGNKKVLDLIHSQSKAPEILTLGKETKKPAPKKRSKSKNEEAEEDSMVCKEEVKKIKSENIFNLMMKKTKKE